MPNYTFECPGCAKTRDEVKRMQEVGKAIVMCECGLRMKRVYGIPTVKPDSFKYPNVMETLPGLNHRDVPEVAEGKCELKRKLGKINEKYGYGLVAD